MSIGKILGPLSHFSHSSHQKDNKELRIFRGLNGLQSFIMVVGAMLGCGGSFQVLLRPHEWSYIKSQRTILLLLSTSNSSRMASLKQYIDNQGKTN